MENLGKSKGEGREDLALAKNLGNGRILKGGTNLLLKKRKNKIALLKEEGGYLTLKRKNGKGGEIPGVF